MTKTVKPISTVAMTHFNMHTEIYPTKFFFTFTIMSPPTMQFFGKMYLNFTLHVLASAFDSPHLRSDIDKIPFQIAPIPPVFLLE